MNAFIASYAQVKAGLAEALGASEALLHVHMGLAIFVVTALLLRRRMASIWPLALVVAFATLNEVIDYLGLNRAPLTRSATDLLNTIIWPLVLFLVARRGSGVRTRI